jgi:hypothetical protein
VAAEAVQYVAGAHVPQLNINVLGICAKHFN